MPHNGGRVNVNLHTPRPYYECVTLNACKQQVNNWQGTGTTEDYRSLIDIRGYPTRMPTGVGATWVTTQLWIPRPLAGTVWVLDWPGTATLALSSVYATPTQNIISSNRREYTFTSDVAAIEIDSGQGYLNPASLVVITISSMSGNAFANGEIRLFNKAYESLLDAGEIFDPQFKARTEAFGLIRLMDYTLPFGQHNNQSVWDHRIDDDYYSYVTTDRVYTPGYCGASTGTNDQVVSQPPTAISSWTDGQIVQWTITSIPTNTLVTAATNDNPGIFTAVGHPFETGDIIEFRPRSDGNASWRSLHGQITTGDIIPSFTVTKESADTFSIGVDTSSFGAYPSSGYLRAYKQVTLKVGSLDAVKCARLRGATTLYPEAHFTAGGLVTGMWDAKLNRLMLTDREAPMTGLVGSWPVSVMMRMVVDAGAHPWFAFPFGASNEYVTNFVTEVMALQPSWMVPKYEYTNETWNYWPTGNLTAWANKDPTYGSSDYNAWYGNRSGELADLIGDLYDGSGKEWEFCIGVRATQASATSFNNARMKCPPISGYVNDATPGNSALYPISKCHAIHINPYYGPAIRAGTTAADYNGGALIDAVYNYLQGGDLREQAFDWMRDLFIYPSEDGAFTNVFYLNAFIEDWIPPWKPIADANLGRNGTPIKLYHYEGGPDWSSSQFVTGFPTTHSGSGSTITVANVKAFCTAFRNSDQYGQLFRMYFNASIDHGVEFPSQYSLATPETSSQCYAAWPMNDFNSPVTPAYTELLAFNNRQRRITLRAVLPP